MEIAIYGRAFADNFIPQIQEFFDLLYRKNVTIKIFDAFSSFLRPRIKLPENIQRFSEFEHLKNKTDILISIGGDGSILDAATLVRHSGIPILGINTGRLGFLSNIAKDDIKNAIDAIYLKNYRLEQRTLIQVNTEKKHFGELNFALNELTLQKKDTGTMISIHVYIDNNYLNTYWSDGLIIATPTGSTAYSLSCGGPIVVPGSENFVITPVCPHNLNMRPIVISDSCQISLKAEGRSKQFLMVLDSRSETIEGDTEIIIKKAPFKINFIQLENQHYFSTIRQKLLWGIDKRN
jgi:NAD+ kinase